MLAAGDPPNFSKFSPVYILFSFTVLDTQFERPASEFEATPVSLIQGVWNAQWSPRGRKGATFQSPPCLLVMAPPNQ